MLTNNAQHSIKQCRRVQRSAGSHWVGNGFPVRSLFSYQDEEPLLSPFLLLDYAGPLVFPPTSQRLGVGEHPHRGFETVSIVYAGEVEHRDSSGGGGRIGPGDVQWMTAASGVVHEEFHGRDFAQRGGLFEMVQLWVNLPAQYKMAAPRYQGIVCSQIPVVSLPNGQGSLRVIAGAFAGEVGPAQTHTPMQMWDLRLTTAQPLEFAVPDGHSALLVVLQGTVRVAGGAVINAAEVGLFERAGGSIRLDSAENVTALLLSGEPIEEPIVGSGPFVMNTAQEIRQAMLDYRDGKMGHLA